MNTNWYLHGRLMGQTHRQSSTNLVILCPDCGQIWGKIETPLGRHWWTASHQRCDACGLGSLIGADWTSRPYAPYALPTALLVRELDLASSHPDTYNP
jgi:hypothetical protein